MIGREGFRGANQTWNVYTIANGRAESCSQPIRRAGIVPKGARAGACPRKQCNHLHSQKMDTSLVVRFDEAMTIPHTVMSGLPIISDDPTNNI